MDDEARRTNARRLAEHITKQFAQQGKLVEGGWMAYQALALEGTSDVQRTECRKAFFFGAHHIFSSIMGILDPGMEPTENDLIIMDKLNAELEHFVEQMKKEGWIA